MEEGLRSHGLTALGPLHAGFAKLRGWSALLTSILLGAFSAVAFAPFHFTPVLILSFTGLIWMIDGARSHRKWGKAVFARGWGFGVGFFLVGMHWTAAPFLVEPEKHLIFIWMPLLLLPGGMALIWGAATAMASSFWSSSPSRVFVFTIFFALGEWVRGHLFGGFPWNLPGTSWIPGGAMSQLASIGGVYWLSLITIFIVSSPAAFVDTRESRSLLQRVLPAFLAVIILATGWGWGLQRLSTETTFTGQSIVLMDSGVPQDEKWEIGPDRVLQSYVDLIQREDSEPNDIIVWPEAAIPTTLFQDPNGMDVISVYIGSRKLIVGSARFDLKPSGEREYFNSVAVLDHEAGRSGTKNVYNKFRLVPFGELSAAKIIPFGESLSSILPDAIQQFVPSGFNPGPGPTVLYPDGMPPFVPMICYEALFPEIARNANIKDRAQWMVVVSNDAWFGAGMGPQQHYAQNRYRAIETGLPIVRVASRGTSAIVDGKGREVFAAPLIKPAEPGWTTSYGRGVLPNAETSTLFQNRIGISLFWICGFLLAGLAFLSWRR